MTIEWRPELKEKASTSNSVRKNYERVLLAFEEHFSQGAPERSIPNTWGSKAAGKREAKVILYTHENIPTTLWLSVK